jgi:beta-1,4-mannosyl-glycoprotein beta-1,4-N-acetylglucosaminyltransferase
MPKIIDAFMFFNELELLEIRLNELDSIIDQFVIVESLERHGSVDSKPAHIRDSWRIVKPFEKKIKYVLLPHLQPPFSGPPTGWKRENYQRNVILDYVSDLSTGPDDILIVSDADEIPRAEAIRGNLSAIKEGLHRLVLDVFYYNVNRFVGVSWEGAGFPIIGPVSEFLKGGTKEFAEDRISVGLSAIRGMTYPEIADGGWHFSYFGGVDRMREKVSSFAESYLDLATTFMRESKSQVARDVMMGNDIYHREIYKTFTWRPANDSRLPKYFLDNVRRYKHFVG